MDEPDLVTGTLSKALGGIGGFVATNAEVAEYIKFNSRAFIYSTSSTPGNTAALIKAMEIIEHRYSPDVIGGTILEQRPGAGAPVKTGRVFKVVVSRGSELIIVPRVRGFTVRQAELIITEAGFTVGGRAPSDDPSIPVGTVAGTIPDADVRLTRGTVVHLLVNEVAQDWAWCPNLVGKNIEEARSILRERRLMIGRVDRRFDDNLLPGTVIEQSKTPGEELSVGTEINLVISRDR